MKLGPSKGKNFKPKKWQRRSRKVLITLVGSMVTIRPTISESKEIRVVKMPEKRWPQKHEFVGVIECNAAHVATYISGWWIDSAATNHNSKTEMVLWNSLNYKRGIENLHGQLYLS